MVDVRDEGTATQWARHLTDHAVVKPTSAVSILSDARNFKSAKEVLLWAAVRGGFELRDGFIQVELFPDGRTLENGKSGKKRLTKAGEDALIMFLRGKLDTLQCNCEAVDPNAEWGFQNREARRKAVSRWVREGKPGEFKYAVQLCFALELDACDSEKFIIEWGSSKDSGEGKGSAFDPQESWDYVYRACLESGESYATAKQIINRLRSYPDTDALREEDAVAVTLEGYPELRVAVSARREAVDNPLGHLEKSSDSGQVSKSGLSVRVDSASDNPRLMNVNSFIIYDDAEEIQRGERGPSATAWKVYVTAKASLCLRLVGDVVLQSGEKKSLIRVGNWLEDIRPYINEGEADEAACSVLALLEKTRLESSRDTLIREWWRFVRLFKAQLDFPDLVDGMRGEGGRRTLNPPISDETLLLETISGRGRVSKKPARGSKAKNLNKSNWDPIPAKQSSFPFAGKGLPGMRFFFAGFPEEEYIIKMGLRGPSEGASRRVRKAILLFHFLEYSMRWADAKDEDKPWKNLDGRDASSYGLEDFLGEANSLLVACGLASLEEGSTDPLDWLVVLCIKQYDPKIKGGRGIDPKKLFNVTVSRSFSGSREAGPPGNR